MGIYKVRDRRGRRRYLVSKYWPNGSDPVGECTPRITGAHRRFKHESRPASWKGEALFLTWKRVDPTRRLLWLELTKDDEPREIPLLKYANGYLVGLVRYLSTPYVFVNTRTGTRWVNPDKPLRRAAERVGLKVE